MSTMHLVLFVVVFRTPRADTITPNKSAVRETSQSAAGNSRNWYQEIAAAEGLLPVDATATQV